MLLGIVLSGMLNVAEVQTLKLFLICLKHLVLVFCPDFPCLFIAILLCNSWMIKHCATGRGEPQASGLPVLVSSFGKTGRVASERALFAAVMDRLMDSVQLYLQCTLKHHRGLKCYTESRIKPLAQNKIQLKHKYVIKNGLGHKTAKSGKTIKSV